MNRVFFGNMLIKIGIISMTVGFTTLAVAWMTSKRQAQIECLDPPQKDSSNTSPPTESVPENEFLDLATTGLTKNSDTDDRKLEPTTEGIETNEEELEATTEEVETNKEIETNEEGLEATTEELETTDEKKEVTETEEDLTKVVDSLMTGQSLDGQISSDQELGENQVLDEPEEDEVDSSVSTESEQWEEAKEMNNLQENKVPEF